MNSVKVKKKYIKKIDEKNIYETLKTNVQDPQTEKYKTLLREMKENLNKRR